MRILLLFMLCIAIHGTEATFMDSVQGVFDSTAETISKAVTGAVDRMRTSAVSIYDWATNNWECGTEKFCETKPVTKKEAIEMCPHAASQLNSLCIVHNHCYADKKRQALCDDQFCSALAEVKMNSTESTTCSLTKTMCGAVRNMGDKYYKN